MFMFWGGREGLGFFPSSVIQLPNNLCMFQWIFCIFPPCRNATSACNSSVRKPHHSPGQDWWWEQNHGKKGQKGPEKPLWALAHPSLCPGAGPALPLPAPRDASPAHPQRAPCSLELLFQYLPISTIKQLFLLSNLDLSLQFKAITVCLILWGSSEKKK